MYRLTIAILAVVDAAIAAAVGIAATLAPLTLLWVLAMGGTADWAALWPTSATIWQLGHLVPLQITLPGEYLAAAGIDASAASFVLSVAPLAFAGFTAIFAARSGVRASRADAWATGVLTGTVTFGAIATVIALTSANTVAVTSQWEAIALPTLVFAVPLMLGAVITEWREAPSGRIARLRDRIESAPNGWGDAPGLIVRGGAVVLTGLLGLGALAVSVALVLRGGEVVALFEAAHVDLLGAIVLTLAQLAYLPTLVVWGMSFVAGPGFAVGTGTAVSPAGTQLGVLPGVPVLGALPESTSPWLLLLALLPIGLGALAGWIARSHLVAIDIVREGDGTGEHATDQYAAREHEPIGARVVITLGIAVLSGAGAAVLALLASGSIGPGRLAEVGPEAGPLALTVGVEVAIGAGILLLSPRRRARRTAAADHDESPLVAVVPLAEVEPELSLGAEPEPGVEAESELEREISAPEPEPEIPAPDRASPADDTADADETPTADLGARRPRPLPPLD